MNRCQVFALGLGLGSLIPLAIDLVTSGWYWNHFVSADPFRIAPQGEPPWPD